MISSCKFSFRAISILAAAILAVAMIGVSGISAYATTAPSNSGLFAMQDLGDNDQDGIANYMDPDDDNDGVVDDLDYAPFDPLVQNPPAPEPSPTPVPSPVPTATVPPTQPVTPTEPPTVPTETAQPSQPDTPSEQPAESPSVVTGLPETGTGHDNPETVLPLITSVLFCTLTIFVIEKRFRTH